MRLKQLKLLSNKSQSRKAYYSYLTPGAVARSVAGKLRKQILRSILAFGTFLSKLSVTGERMELNTGKHLCEASLGTVWLSN